VLAEFFVQVKKLRDRNAAYATDVDEIVLGIGLSRGDGAPGTARLMFSGHDGSASAAASIT
jgi:hypothetical protein